MPVIDYYRILDLKMGANMYELKKAFRNKAKLFHPDVNSSPDAEKEFILIHTAYEIVLAHLLGKDKLEAMRDPAAEAEARRRKAEERAQSFARMQYEKFMKECEAYHNSPYSWIFKILYYGLFYLYMFCAMIFAMVPVYAGVDGGIFYFFICLPLYVLAYFTVKMAYGWKREIDPLFN